jgi:hypothetical protein
MYELFDAAQQAGQWFLIRTAQNRMTVDNKRIMDEIRQQPRAGRARVPIPRDSRRNVKEREAVLQVRYGQFEIRRPAVLNKIKTLRGPVEVSVIYAAEETADADGEPAARFLMTNGAVDSFESAYEKVCRYTQRRKIERFRYVLKSGRAAEKLQARTMDKTAVLVLMYSIIAAAIMNLTYIARLKPDLPCTVYFDEEEWLLLYRAANKTKQTPVKPYTIGEAVSCLGRLGGPKRAPSDGPLSPGDLPANLVNTVWSGSTPAAGNTGWITLSFRAKRGSPDHGEQSLTVPNAAVISYAHDNTTAIWDYAYNNDTREGTAPTNGYKPDNTATGWNPGAYTISADGQTLTFTNFMGEPRSYRRFR